MDIFMQLLVAALIILTSLPKLLLPSTQSVSFPIDADWSATIGTAYFGDYDVGLDFDDQTGTHILLSPADPQSAPYSIFSWTEQIASDTPLLDWQGQHVMTNATKHYIAAAAGDAFCQWPSQAAPSTVCYIKFAPDTVLFIMGTATQGPNDVEKIRLRRALLEAIAMIKVLPR